MPERWRPLNLTLASSRLEMAHMSRRLCIGLPVFNGGRYLEEALDSLLGQTFSDFELLILDNASTDSTPDICQAYAVRDQRIRYVRNQENIGAARNWYRAFDLSSSEYFKWAADDDVYAPEFLRQCVAVLDQDPSVVVAYTKTKIIDEEGRITQDFDVAVDTTSPKPHVRLYNTIGIDHFGIQMYGVMRADVLRKTQPYIGYAGWDHNTLAELCLLGQSYKVPEYLFFHRVYDTAWGAIVKFKKSQPDLSLYEPAIDWRFDLSFLNRSRNYVAAVARAPLNHSERLLCYAQLVRLIPKGPTEKVKRRWNRLRNSRQNRIPQEGS